MVIDPAPSRHGPSRGLGVLIVAALLGGPVALVAAREDKLEVLHIGTSGDLSPAKEAPNEKSNLATLQTFLKEETGLKNEIVRQKDWRELADKMAKGEMQIGVFQGYEFAWAAEEHPKLKPLALAINLDRYPLVFVVTNRTNQAKDFAGLQGQSLALPDGGPPYLRLFVEKECQAKGKSCKDFFSTVTTNQSVEDAIDDAVDGKVQAVAVDRAALEAYKEQKSGRFAKLKEVAKSEPLPPVVIAYHDKGLDAATRMRFEVGLFGAAKKEKGRAMLNLFHLTRFDAPPADFGKVLADTRKNYPAPKSETK